MIVVLDTNAFVYRLHLLRNGIGPLFLHFLRSRQGHLFVPDILSQEYREQAVTLVRDSGAEIDGKFARIHAIVGEIVEYTIPSDEEVTTAVQARLQELAFLSIGQPLTEAILLAAGRRSLDKKRPCTKTDHGYKDSLIWESILCLAPGSEVHLVTKDQGFYDGEHLAAGLREEAEQRQLRVTAHKELEEGKTRNGNLRTLSRHRQLTGAGPQRPKLVRIQRFFRLPGVIARQIDVLPAER